MINIVTWLVVAGLYLEIGRARFAMIAEVDGFYVDRNEQPYTSCEHAAEIISAAFCIVAWPAWPICRVINALRERARTRRVVANAFRRAARPASH